MTSSGLTVPGSVEFRGQLELAVLALARLTAWLRSSGSLAGVALVVGGLLGLLAADRLRRPVAFLGGAGVGALAAFSAGASLPGGLSATAWAWVAAGVAGVVSALAPPLFPALAGALVGAHLGSRVAVAGRPAIGAAVAAAVGAALLLVGARSAAAVLASLAGGLALGVGLLALAGGRPIAAEVAARPVVLLAFAVVTGIAGAAYQLGAGRERGRAPEPPRLPRE